VNKLYVFDGTGTAQRVRNASEPGSGPATAAAGRVAARNAPATTAAAGRGGGGRPAPRLQGGSPARQPAGAVGGHSRDISEPGAPDNGVEGPQLGDGPGAAIVASVWSR
jgi:hypothetical protein